MRTPPRWILLLLLTLLASAADAKSGKLGGLWNTPMGKVRLSQQGGEVTGVLVAPATGCQIKKGSRVLSGVLVEDNLTGEVSVCLQGDGCPASIKTFVLLLVAKNKRSLSGALHLPNPSCRVRGLGTGRGLRLTRVGTRPRPPAQASPQAGADGVQYQSLEERTKAAQEHLKRGKQLLVEGAWDEARKAFEAAIEADPSEASSYSGIGITYYARNQYTEALRWYKKALEINPDRGDSYYNMACIYALEGKKALALRYLRIAILNRYLGAFDPAQILADEDWAKLRDDPDFLALLSSAPQPAASAPASAGGASSSPAAP